MKTFKLISLVFFLTCAFSSFAVTPNHAINPAIAPNLSSIGEMTIEDFLAVDIKKLQQKSGQKMKWSNRLAFKMIQKKMARKVRKGKLDKTAKFSSVANPANRRGRLSLILSCGGFILLFIPVVGIIGLLAALVGFGIGLSGLKKDEDNTMAIVGTVVGGVVLLLFLVALIWIAALF